MGVRELVRAYKLKKNKGSTYRPRDYPGFELLKTVAISFEDGDDTKEVLNFAELLRKNGKQVELLGYIPQRKKDIPSEPVFPYVSRDAIRWYGRPVCATVMAFLDGSYQVFVDLIRSDEHPFAFISSGVSADFKIGCCRRKSVEYDLQLESGEGKSVKDFFEEVEYYLHFINKQPAVSNNGSSKK